MFQITEANTVNNQNNRDLINDTVIVLLKKTKRAALVNEIYMEHPEVARDGSSAQGCSTPTEQGGGNCPQAMELIARSDHIGPRSSPS